jgi:SAM-dependent methyltransferase
MTSAPSTSIHCRLCSHADCRLVATVKQRHLYHCPVCDLVFVPSEEHLTLEQERNRYDLHTNTATDEGYVSYLNAFASVLDCIPLVAPSILDFGSGRECVLAGILHQRGTPCDTYDPLYGIGMHCRAGTYDVVLACEVLEHLRELPDELGLMRRLVRPGGYVAVRTQLRPLEEKLDDWWYVQDPTHINFFSLMTIDHIAAALAGPVHWSNASDIFVIGPIGAFRAGCKAESDQGRTPSAQPLPFLYLALLVELLEPQEDISASCPAASSRIAVSTSAPTPPGSRTAHPPSFRGGSRGHVPPWRPS